MFKGETVVIEHVKQKEIDPFGVPVYETSYEDVSNVLVAPAAGSDAIETERPNGDNVQATLYFPKNYQGGTLRNKRIKVRGEWFKVVGVPLPYTETPGDWNMSVNVGWHDG